MNYSHILTIPNTLSFLRIPLAFFLLYDDVTFRFGIILAAALTDFLDGFLARKWNQKSPFGTTLDPISDKFFALFMMFIFLSEERIHLLGILCLISRDIAVILFGVILLMKKSLKTYSFHAIFFGKIATTLQFVTFIAINFGYSIPREVYFSFILLGVLSFVELLIPFAKREGITL